MLRSGQSHLIHHHQPTLKAVEVPHNHSQFSVKEAVHHNNLQHIAEEVTTIHSHPTLQGDEAEAVKSTPPKATNGTVTRQRSGKATPARPQPPKHAPKPISKSKKSKKGKGKAVAKKALMQLYGYWRSGCTWRVRLCLALKGMNFGKEVDYSPVHLVKDGGE